LLGSVFALMKKKKSIVLFLSITFLFWTSLYLYVPTLPTYIKMKTPQLATVGLVLSMYGLCVALIRLPMGLAGDVIGWGKPLILLGIFFSAFGAFVMGKGSTIWWLAAGRALTGLSAGTWVLLITVFSTYFDMDQSVYASSMLTFFASLGRMISTGSTGFLNRIGGYSFSFYLAAVTACISFVLVLFVNEKHRDPRKVTPASIVRLLVNRYVLLPTLISIVVHYADWSVTFGFLPVLLQDMGAGDITKSLLISVNIASITAANLLNTLVLRKVRYTLLLLPGAFLFFIGMIIIICARSVQGVFPGTICMGFAFGMVYPILIGLSIQKVARNERSTAMGIHQSLYAVGMFVGPWLSGIIADRTGIRPMFGITAGFYLCAVYSLVFLLMRREADKKNTGLFPDVQSAANNGDTLH
jgi:DHA1 family multidrug resistance protein-like MFS transporter